MGRPLGSKNKQPALVCGNCGFPVVVEEYKRGERKGQPRRVTVRHGGPKTEEEALAKGWKSTEFGLICPTCAAAGDVAEHVGETDVGIEQLATSVLEAVGEDRIQDLKQQMDAVLESSTTETTS